MRRDDSMRALLLLILLCLSARISAQNTSVSASEKQDQPQLLVLSLNGLDVSQIENAQLFTVDDGYAVDSSGQLVQASQNVTAEFISSGPFEPGMGTALL